MSIWRSITKLVRRLVRAELSGIHTTIICQIEAYTAATNTATVQPVYKLARTGGLETVQYPQLEDVPVRQFGSGKLWATCPPAVGSYGYVNVSERSIEQWQANGGITEHGSSRKFDLSDAILEIGLCPLIPDGDNGAFVVPVNTDRIELRTRLGTTFIAVLDDGTVEISGTTTTLNGGTDWAVQYTALKSAFDTLVTDVNNLVTAYNAHIHITTATVGVGPPGVIAPTTSTGTPTTADMTSSKIADLKVP